MEEKKIALRLPVELAAQVEAMAKRQERSVNGQIVYMLAQAAKHWPYLAEQALADERAPGAQ